jgi:hypothetical protein
MPIQAMGLTNGPSHKSSGICPTSEAQMWTYNLEKTPACGISATLALSNVCRLFGMAHANRDTPYGVTGQKTLLPIPMPPVSAW